ncbi:hypothetical protein FOZ60_017330 [Perkinsus olseni]|uniref:Uncharacterized protein n=1 Tax=Perkinsus olseni TaxID=32597 RepID=A0A7J6P2Y1_PEROL|nr:hypothetical protein FOZ60_017330 [Perkinsus olseni]
MEDVNDTPDVLRVAKSGTGSFPGASVTPEIFPQNPIDVYATPAWIISQRFPTLRLRASRLITSLLFGMLTTESPLVVAPE